MGLVMFKLTFFVPLDYAESVKDALFNIGVGKIGDYDCCCFQIKGEGQFRPLPGSNPYLGDKNRIEKVEEYRIEMVLEEILASKAITVLLQAHPYETPAYDLQEVFTLDHLTQS